VEDMLGEAVSSAKRLGVSLDELEEMLTILYNNEE